VTFLYGDTEGTVHARLDYIGGQSSLERYGEYIVMGVAVAAMLGVFLVDARRRRLRGSTGEPPAA